jgi:hypothetical protein
MMTEKEHLEMMMTEKAHRMTATTKGTTKGTTKSTTKATQMTNQKTMIAVGV